MLRPKHGVGGDAGRNSALVKKFHPDQRRPTYSAARANEAKDVLRRHHRKLQTPLHLSNASPRGWFWRARSHSRQSSKHLIKHSLCSSRIGRGVRRWPGAKAHPTCYSTRGYALAYRGTTPERSKAGSAIGRSPARRPTTRWRRAGSRTSGGINQGRGRRSAFDLPQAPLICAARDECGPKNWVRGRDADRTSIRRTAGRI